MAEVFISYSRDDQATVAEIAKAVQDAGYSVWWDKEILPHNSFSDIINEKIGQAKAVIVVWSGKAAASEWVRGEADHARQERKLVQTLIDGRAPPIPFNQIQFADLTGFTAGSENRNWQMVLASLAVLCRGEEGRSPPISPPPAPPAAPLATPAPQPAAYEAPPGPPPASGRGNGLLFAVVGFLLALVLAGGFYVWQQQGEVDSAEEAGLDAADTAAREAGFTHIAVVSSPDGEANIRSDRGTGNPIVGRAFNGDRIYVIPSEQSWWQVSTSAGVTGYCSARLFYVERPI